MTRKVKAKSPKHTRRGRTSSSRISSKNQVTIPVEMLRDLGLESGDFVNFTSDGKKRITLFKGDEPQWKSAMRELIGSEPGLGERYDYKKEREEWDSKLTRRG
jgi:bifunctional DNA-binding transcriptional regulator/antitoxin component of YhaV-PrlF toxin-antitoxin module